MEWKGTPLTPNLQVNTKFNIAYVDEPIQINKHYRHFKGELYFTLGFTYVTGAVLNGDKNDSYKCVRYVSVETGLEYCRYVQEFNEVFLYGGYETRRFRPVEIK